MKPRQVELKLLVETDAPLELLRVGINYQCAMHAYRNRPYGGWRHYRVRVVQAQANVVEPKRKKR